MSLPQVTILLQAACHVFDPATSGVSESQNIPDTQTHQFSNSPIHKFTNSMQSLQPGNIQNILKWHAKPE